MGIYKVIKGNLITLALNGQFDVIGHCTNAQCVMGGGVAVPMREVFRCNEYPMEDVSTRGDVNKLGQIDWGIHGIKDGELTGNYAYKLLPEEGYVAVVNMYGQYHYGMNHLDGVSKPLDYEALTLCMRKMNKIFKGMRIGFPYVIGCGLAGGVKNVVIEIIKREFKDCDVTMVNYN